MSFKKFVLFEALTLVTEVVESDSFDPPLDLEAEMKTSQQVVEQCLVICVWDELGDMVVEDEDGSLNHRVLKQEECLSSLK